MRFARSCTASTSTCAAARSTPWSESPVRASRRSPLHLGHPARRGADPQRQRPAGRRGSRRPRADARSPGPDRVHPAGTDVQPRPELHRRPAARLRAEGGDVAATRTSDSGSSTCSPGSGSPIPSGSWVCIPTRSPAAWPSACSSAARWPPTRTSSSPTSRPALDVAGRGAGALTGAQRRAGLAMLLVTHNLGVVADLCDTVSVMKDGNIVERAAIDQIFESPQQEYTRELRVIPRRTVGGIVTDPTTPLLRALTRSSGQGPRGHVPGRRGKQARVIRGVSFDLAAGETLSLVGNPVPARRPSVGPSSALPRSPAARSPSRARRSATSPVSSAASSRPTSRSSSRIRTRR